MGRFDATMNGKSLCEIDPSVLLVDINEQTPVETFDAVSRAVYAGSLVLYRQRERLSVRLTICIREYNVERRTQILNKISAWAGDSGWLTISTRPGQRLYVHCDTPPALGSSLRWTDEIIFSLTAYEQPYWEDEVPVVKILDPSENPTGIITHDGTAKQSYAEAYIINKGTGDLTTATIQIGNTKMAFAGLAVASGDSISIYYTDDNLLTIKAGTASALRHRTPDSDDDLITKAGVENAIKVTADQPVQVVVMVRGRYR